MKKSIPTPLSASLVAVFFHSGFSEVNTFFSPSAGSPFPLSFMTSLPGPQVGKLANEHTIFPPVDCSAERAALMAGSNAGSGFLICEKMVGNCVKRDVITALRPG